MVTNTTVRGFIPEIFDTTVYRTIEDNLVLEQIAKAPVIKEPTGEADTIYFTDLGDVTIGSDFDSLTAEDLKDSQVTMLINRPATFCFKVKELDTLMTGIDLEGSQAKRAGYQIKDTIEKYVLQYVGTDANAGTALAATITSANAISQVSEIMRPLLEQNVKESNAWVLLPNWMMLKLKVAGISFSINQGVNGEGGMYWTKDLGFTTYISNTVYNSGTQAAPVSTVLAGSYQAIGFRKIQVPVRTTPLTGGRWNQVDGGALYGYKLVKPKELMKAVFTFGAESTI